MWGREGPWAGSCSGLGGDSGIGVEAEVGQAVVVPEVVVEEVVVVLAELEYEMGPACQRSMEVEVEGRRGHKDIRGRVGQGRKRWVVAACRVEVSTLLEPLWEPLAPPLAAARVIPVSPWGGYHRPVEGRRESHSST